MVVTALKEAVPDSVTPLYRLLRYHMGWLDQEGRPAEASQGKALRPLLCLFVCDAVGGDPAQAMPAAVALDLIHNFSLIHDDIQDEDRERRHRPTLWVLWGRPQALVAGNAMRLVADRALQTLSSRGVPQERVLGASRYLTERYLEMIEGQYLDLNYEGRTDITVDDYLTMISRKTGTLLEAAMYLGAYLGSEDQERVAALRRCGRLLGLAFQARDDILGIWGDEDVLGKATGADLRKQKRSLPVVYALQMSTGARKRRLQELASRPQLEDTYVEEALGILEQTGAQEFAQRLADEKGAEALEWARAAALPQDAQQDLEELVHFVLARQH